MKKYLFILLAALTFVACSDDEKGPTSDYEYPSKSGIQFATEGYSFIGQEDGTIIPTTAVNQPTAQEIETEIVGHAWKYMDGYEIKTDGNIETTPLLTFPWTFANIPDYYMKKTTVREMASCKGSKGAYYNQEYTWKGDGKTFTFMDKARTEEDITILSYDPKTQVMAIMHHTHFSGVINHFYQILFYQRMSAEEAQANLQEYAKGPYRFVTGGDGTPRSLSPESFSAEDFQRHIAEHGWKHMESHQILKDGSIEPQEFFMRRTGGGPTHYYFDKEKVMIYFTNSDNENAHRMADYEYAPENGLISISDTPRGLSIVSYDEKANVLAVIDKTRTHQLLSFFKRMIEQELSQFIIYKS